MGLSFSFTATLSTVKVGELPVTLFLACITSLLAPGGAFIKAVRVSPAELGFAKRIVGLSSSL